MPTCVRSLEVGGCSASKAGPRGLPLGRGSASALVACRRCEVTVSHGPTANATRSTAAACLAKATVHSGFIVGQLDGHLFENAMSSRAPHVIATTCTKLSQTGNARTRRVGSKRYRYHAPHPAARRCRARRCGSAPPRSIVNGDVLPPAWIEGVADELERPRSPERRIRTDTRGSRQRAAFTGTGCSRSSHIDRDPPCAFSRPGAR